MPIIFFRIAWMKYYKGITADDQPFNGGSDENKGEVSNFKPIGNKYYGYVWVHKDGSLKLNNLAATDKTELKDVTVVFFATAPDGGGQRIVGWYKNATLYESNRQIRGRGYRAVADHKDVVLLEEKHRAFPIPKGPGTSNVWYGKNLTSKDLNEIMDYLNDRHSYDRKLLGKKQSTPWQKDILKKQKTELEAMIAVEEYYLLKGYEVTYVHKENLGWDMEATYGDSKLLLEVKGLSGDFNTVELTHNEYSNSKKKNYRICIVSNALDKKMQRLDVYFWNKGRWIDTAMNELYSQELTSARFSLK